MSDTTPTRDRATADDATTLAFADELVPPPAMADADPPVEMTTDAPAAAVDSDTPAPRPRTRWAGIVWGLAFAAIAVAGIRVTSTPGAVNDVIAWASGISVATAIGYGVLLLGALLLVTGLVGLLRRAQRALAERRSADRRE